MTSILESEYIAPTRPYSQDELKYLREKLHQRLRLGEMRVEHGKCKHFYLVKQNSRKEKELRVSDTNDVGNCSVCWKLTKTPSLLRDQAHNLVHVYCNYYYDEPKYLNYEKVDCENIFYLWLYENN